MLGALGVGLVGLLVVSIAAVTFLGTTKSGSESVRLSPADGSTSGGNDDSADAQDPGEATGAPLSEQVAVQIGADLAGEGWVQQEAEPVPMEEAGASCMPPGWREGVTDRYRIAFHAEGIGDTEVRTSAYATAEQAQADLVRASTDEFRACLEQTAEEYSGVDVTVQALPADPSTPGVTYRSTAITSDGPLVQDDTYVIVGRVRAYITYCTCEALDETHRRGIALEAAASLASAQGLPSPA